MPLSEPLSQPTRSPALDFLIALLVSAVMSLSNIQHCFAYFKPYLNGLRPYATFCNWLCRFFFI